MNLDLSDPYNNFVPPPEAPVFSPTEEEFADPLAYIAKIRPIAMQSGICKINPPRDWQPPFAVDVETFRFVPRIQRLNELEAHSRIKLNFLDQLFKFWELQGHTLRIPHVGRKLLDLHDLYKMVEEEGGMEYVSKERKWSRIATKLGLPTAKGQGSIVKMHYERVLYPYFLFKKGDTLVTEKKPVVVPEEEKVDKEDKDYKPHSSLAKATEKHRKSKHFEKEESMIDYSANSELKKLQFFGAGPKAAVPPLNPKDEKLSIELKEEKGSMKTRIKKVSPGVYTTEACSKPAELYGFEQSKREYTLQSFGEMADHFKSTYFNMPVHRVTTGMVEKEFWRLVHSLEEDVCVLYGADIHAVEMGSGFPTKGTPNLLPEDEEYINSGWNLNNLPVLEQSVLCHINADISGMKIPWCYVGMCFSSFCWHIEDHWSYSINYLHWGEPKTWYGCPGTAADQFEAVMRESAPELFEQAPDLLHQLTTIMNPNLLMAKSVPIFRTDQHAGQFVVTFPRAYHAGFNTGYNFAEAVNFCPSDWLSLGRQCIEHYRMLHRQCVFSHEELICKMAADPDSLELGLAAATHFDMLHIVETEKKLRKKLLDRGTVDAEREAFELLPDDERQCDICKTTCFLSSVTCPCSPSRLVCLYHVDDLCHCPASRHCLRYRYTLDELPAMLHRLKIRAESFDNWNMKVTAALEASGTDKLDLGDFKELLQEADEKKFPDSELKNTLATAISEAEKCASVANQLVSKKVRTRNRQSLDGKYVAKLTLDELNCFYEQVMALPCSIREAVLIKELLDKVVAFQEEAQEALSAEVPDSRQLEKLIDIGITLDVDLPEIPRLKQVLQQARWLDEMYSTLKDPQSVTLDVMRKLIESGVGLAPHPALETAMAHLQELLTVSERWEEKARICLQARPRHLKSTLEAIISETRNIPAFLPNVCALREAVRKANEWTGKVEGIQTSDSYPYLEVLEGLVNKGRPIPVRLDQLSQVELQVSAAKSWRERTARTFLKKNSTYTLLEVLSPRLDIGVYNSGKNRKKKTKELEKSSHDGENSQPEVKSEDTYDPATIVASFKLSEVREVDLMRDLRARNMEKSNGGDGDARFCVCRKGAFGFMLQCELCKDWFHGTCVPLPKSAGMKAKPGQPAVLQTSREMKFLCPVCLRSRRPRLETILSLLVSLQKLPVRLAEGEALQCLTERAMAWQDRARQMLTTPELAAALATLSVLTQRRQEQVAREKTQKIISAELRKAASNPELQGHLASVTQSAFGRQLDAGGTMAKEGGSPNSEEQAASPLGPGAESASPRGAGDSMADDIGAEVDIPVVASLGMSSEHAYSSVSKTGTNGSPRKHPRKTPLVARQCEWPVLEISETVRAQLEELMMEGDLLEVTLDETQHIWRLLQACHPHADPRFLDFQDTENQVGGGIKERPEKKVLKVKRRKEKEQIKTKNKLKSLKEKKLKRKKPMGDGSAINNGVNGASTGEKGVEGSDHPSPIKKIKVEEGFREKALKKIKAKRKDKVRLKLNKGPVKTEDTGVKTGEDCITQRTVTGEKIKKKKKFLKVKIEALENKEIEKKKKVLKKMRPDMKVKVKKERKPKNGDKDSDDDNDEDCSATKCLRPVGEEVNWVQCDGCELWFHLLCVGLGKEQVTEEEDYVCHTCSHTSGKSPDTSDIKQEPDGDADMPVVTAATSFLDASSISSDLEALSKAAKASSDGEKHEGGVQTSPPSEPVSDQVQQRKENAEEEDEAGNSEEVVLVEEDDEEMEEAVNMGSQGEVEEAELVEGVKQAEESAVVVVVQSDGSDSALIKTSKPCVQQDVSLESPSQPSGTVVSDEGCSSGQEQQHSADVIES
ncbi:lysine-specific demethylase 5A-like isoform X3 [Pomacea canaliculata]|uniref:lysine-specific demethylase 5A-like isoform X3 n=1 Tax=Pomacea canaliculata TaxID=400727 RepID=UPI000D73F860|nr:lysine-specific demethylase 5A-like isoform X3 [Pomacea canaliculata]